MQIPAFQTEMAKGRDRAKRSEIHNLGLFGSLAACLIHANLPMLMSTSTGVPQIIA